MKTSQDVIQHVKCMNKPLIKNSLNIFNHVSDIVGIRQSTIMQYKNQQELFDDKDRCTEQIMSIIKRIENLDIEK